MKTLNHQAPVNHRLQLEINHRISRRPIFGRASDSFGPNRGRDRWLGAFVVTNRSDDAVVAAAAAVVVDHPVDVYKFGEDVDRHGVGRFQLHLADHLRTAELPLDVGAFLDALISIAHHGDE